MEYVSGRTLKSLIPAEGMPPGTVASMGAQIASALAAAHAAGIVHRDIKPANIMVTPDQQVKVLDFGAAKVTGPAASNPDGETETAMEHTVPGVAVGTLSYMSPEQTRGETVDGRSDIFSLGCVLYEAATGRRAFKGANALATMNEIATATPAAPSSLRSDLPRAFDQLIAACLAKSPVQRPATAAEVVQELKGLAMPTERAIVRPVADRRSVAVIPFRFRTSISDDQFLSVALADAVANRLASNGTLLIRPMATVLKYAATETDWTHIAREVNLDLVVEGTIQKMGPKIRVLAQAHQASDARTLHSSRHDGDVDDLFGLQDRIADAVSNVFGSRIDTAAEPAAAPTQNPLAYELCLRAVDHVARLSKFDVGYAIESLNRAVDLDPNFADAWGLLAHAHSTMGMFLDPNPQWFERAEHAIARTLELDPVQCDALCARAQVLWSPSHGFQNLASLRALNAALRVNPGRASARERRSAILFHLGFYEESQRDAREAELANPKSAMAVQNQGMIALYRGDYQTANELMERTLAMDPALILGNIVNPVAPLLQGRIGEAHERIRKAHQMVPDEPQLTCLRGLIAAYEGGFQRAEQLADDACSENRKSVTHTHHTWHYGAGVYSICGKPGKAMVQLRRCAELGLPNHLLFASDPSLRGLKDHPEFTALLSDLRRQHDQFRAEFGLGETSRAAPME
jgi:eukaryotic-like serine/threonine-protein kinase